MNLSTFHFVFVFLVVFLIGGDGQTTTTTSTTTTTTTTTTTFAFLCLCDNTSVVVAGTGCRITIANGEATTQGCSCADESDIQVVQIGTTYVQYCGDEPTGNYTGVSTTTTTTTPTTTCMDTNLNGICDFDEESLELRCTDRVMSKLWYTIFKVLFIICFLWIVICVAATIIVNCKHKNKGHHRYIHIFEEIGIVFLFLTMMALQLLLRTKETPCKILKVLVEFFMVWVSAAFMFEALFANSLINAKSKKNGSIPPIVNYLASIVLGIIAAVVPYVIEKDEYTPTGLHCFAATTGTTLWGFLVPPWLLITVACFKVQTAFLQCKKYDLKYVDHDQIYWSYRSSRALPPFSWLLFGIYVTTMFGLDQQLPIILILAVIMTFVFGPAIFFVHTYCHENSSKKFHPKYFGFYTPCPEEIRPPSPTPSDDIVSVTGNNNNLNQSETEPLPGDPNEPKKEPKKPSPKKKDQPKRPLTPPAPPINEKNHGGAQHFYDWLTNNQHSPNPQEESAMILFKPRP